MTVAFTIPNSDEASFPVQAEPDRGDFVALTAAARGTGVVSGCVVTASGSPDLDTHVAAGNVVVEGAAAVVAGGSVTHGAADGLQSRIDLVVYDDGTNDLLILAGTPAATPLFSASYDPGTHVLLAAVLIEAASTAVTAGHIVDKRVMYVSSSMTAADILTAIKTVDGSGSGLDADLLDGISSAGFDAAGTASSAVSAHAGATDPHGDRAYADTLIAAADAMVFKNVIDCSANPNYPAADRGWTYRVSVAGKIGGASGVNVEAGDLLMCLTDSTASGNQATVGSSWTIAQTNLDGAVIGPASATDSAIALFDTTSGKLLKNSAVLLSALLTTTSAAATYQTLANIDTDSAMAANSDTKYASQKATKTALAAKAPTASPTFTGTVTVPDATANTAAAALRQAMFAEVAVPLVSTYYVRSPAQLGTTTGTPTLNLMTCVPIVFTNAGTLVSIAAANNANTATAVCRLGLYADNGSGQPGALIDDYGTVDFSTGPSTKTIVISRAVTAMTLYWLAAVEQTAATSAKVASNGSGSGLTPGYTTPLNSTIPTQCWTQASVSAGLPNPAVVTATGTSSIIVEVKI